MERRLSDAGSGNLREVEHAAVSDLMLIEVAVGWETALDFLRRFLRGDLPGIPVPEDAAEEVEPSPEMMRTAQERGQAWAALVNPES